MKNNKDIKMISKDDFIKRFKEQLIYANFHLRPDALKYLKGLHNKLVDRTKRTQKEIVNIFIKNAEIAECEKRGLCQDTGYAQIYAYIGRNVILDFNLYQTIDEAVSQVYRDFKLRMSLAHPITRKNTEDNIPAFINIEFVEGSSLELYIMLKGGGSENVSKAGYLLPTASMDDIVEWVVEHIREIGSKACPPYILGVAVGGNLGSAVHFSKKLLLQDIDEIISDDLSDSSDPPASLNPFDPLDSVDQENKMAKLIKNKVNALPIGFQGLDFGETVLSVKVKILPCHIATLPIAVSVGCNSIRQGHFKI